jgi:hypothetical protein
MKQPAMAELVFFDWMLGDHHGRASLLRLDVEVQIQLMSGP